MKSRLVPDALAQHAARRPSVLGPPTRAEQELLGLTVQRRANISKPLGVPAREAQRVTKQYDDAD